MYPNSALSVGQVLIIAVVALATLSIWLIGMFVAAREPRQRQSRAVATPLPLRSSVTDESEPKAA